MYETSVECQDPGHCHGDGGHNLLMVVKVCLSGGSTEARARNRPNGCQTKCVLGLHLIEPPTRNRFQLKYRFGVCRRQNSFLVGLKGQGVFHPALCV